MASEENYAALTAQILQNAAQGQQRRIADYSQANAERQAIPYAAIGNAEDAYVKGLDIGQKKRAGDTVEAQRQAALRGQEIQNRTEEAKSDWLDSPDEDTGLTLRGRMAMADTARAEADAKQAQNNVDFQKENNESALKNAAMSRAAIDQEIKTGKYNLHNSQLNDELSHLNLQIHGTLSDMTQDADVRQKNAQAMTESFIAHHPEIDRNLILGMAHDATSSALANLAQNERTKTFLFDQSDEGKQMRSTVAPYTDKISALQDASNAYNDYKSKAALDLGPGGQVESAETKAAAERFAVAAARVNPAYVKPVEAGFGPDLKTKSNQLQSIWDSMYHDVASGWQLSKRSGITPNAQTHIEVRQIDDALANMAQRNPASSAQNPFLNYANGNVGQAPAGAGFLQKRQGGAQAFPGRPQAPFPGRPQAPAGGPVAAPGQKTQNVPPPFALPPQQQNGP